MAIHNYKKVFLITLPRDLGWKIIGVKKNNTQELIIELTEGLNQTQVENLANKLAKILAGKEYAEID